MTYKTIASIAIIILVTACQNSNTTTTLPDNNTTNWNNETLSNRANQHLDSTKWDEKLLQQDIEDYGKYSEIFKSYPLNKSPFPVAEYDYAVFSIPFTLESDNRIFKGIRIGEYKNPYSDTTIDKLTLLILTNDMASVASTLVESRNYPYLTAQGSFEAMNNEFDWVFTGSPDAYSTLVLNMKLFDLRFGETIIVYPQSDKSFRYNQIEDSPNNYDDFDAYQQALLKVI